MTAASIIAQGQLSMKYQSGGHFLSYIGAVFGEPLKTRIKVSPKLPIYGIKSANNLYDYIDKMLEKKANLRHCDLHWNNIMFKVKNNIIKDFKVIDFGDVERIK